jgi:hypothetical protein
MTSIRISRQADEPDCRFISGTRKDGRPKRRNMWAARCALCGDLVAAHSGCIEKDGRTGEWIVMHIGDSTPSWAPANLRPYLGGLG